MCITCRKLVAGLLVLDLLLLVAVFALLVGGGPVRPAVPNPNGFDDLVKAGQAITGNTGDYLHLSQERLERSVKHNVIFFEYKHQRVGGI